MFVPPVESAAPLQLTMQPLSTSNSLKDASEDESNVPVEPLPLRWQQSLRNVSEAQDIAQRLSSALDEALYLDVRDWRRAVPASQHHEEKSVSRRIGRGRDVLSMIMRRQATLAHPRACIHLQILQQQVRELETQLAACLAELSATQTSLKGSTARVKELEEELENHARVFELHYDALLEKEKTIKELEAVVSALSLGSGDAV